MVTTPPPYFYFFCICTAVMVEATNPVHLRKTQAESLCGFSDNNSGHTPSSRMIESSKAFQLDIVLSETN